MSKDQPTLEWPGKQAITPPPLELVQTAVVLPDPSSEVANQRLIQGENLGVMSALLAEFEGEIDLIYADPPFLSGKSYRVRTGQGEDSRRPEGWKTG